MDFMSGGKVTSFESDILGNLPLSNTPPDVLGGGAVMFSSVLLAFGLHVRCIRF